MHPKKLDTFEGGDGGVASTNKKAWNAGCTILLTGYFESEVRISCNNVTILQDYLFMFVLVIIFHLICMEKVQKQF